MHFPQFRCARPNLCVKWSIFWQKSWHSRSCSSSIWTRVLASQYIHEAQYSSILLRHPRSVAFALEPWYTHQWPCTHAQPFKNFLVSLLSAISAWLCLRIPMLNSLRLRHLNWIPVQCATTTSELCLFEGFYHVSLLIKLMGFFGGSSSIMINPECATCLAKLSLQRLDICKNQ